MNLVSFQRAPPTKRTSGGGGGGGGGVSKRGATAPPPPLRMSWAVFRFIDPRIFYSNDIHRPHPGPQANIV